MGDARGSGVVRLPRDVLLVGLLVTWFGTRWALRVLMPNRPLGPSDRR
jgi:hypothetical protein